ncbi:hypothetical protein PR001_g28564 [Phytophthora rubi]|nr:hypothetical protein PR001_g28564 [Phytophthora rubi]
MFARLGNFQSYLDEELGIDEPVGDINDVVQIKKSETEPKEEMRDADAPTVESPDDSSEVQTSAGLPGAILDANEEEAVVVQTMQTHT